MSLYSRVRTRRNDGETTVETDSSSFSQQNCNVGSFTTEVELQDYIEQTMSDVQTPNYYEKKAKGILLPENPCQSVTKVVKDGYFKGNMNFNYPCGCVNDVFQYTSGRHPYLHKLISPISTPQQAKDEAEGLTSQLLKDAIAKARNKEMDLLTTLAEMQETLDYLAGRVSFVVQTLKDLKRAQKKILRAARIANVSNLSKELANLWLEYRYALRPIIFDIESAQNTLNNAGLTKKRSFGNVTKSFAVSSTPTRDVYPCYGKSFFLSHSLKTDVTVRAGCCSTANITNGIIEHIQFNPMTTAWELVPLSFVVDWVFDIGNSLLAFSDTGAGGTLSNLWSSIEYVTRGEYVLDEVPPNAAYPFYDCNGVYVTNQISHTYDGIVRNPRGYFKEYIRTPRLMSDVDYTPRLNVNLDIRRVADALALVRSFMAS